MIDVEKSINKHVEETMTSFSEAIMQRVEERLDAAARDQERLNAALRAFLKFIHN